MKTSQRQRITLIAATSLLAAACSPDRPPPPEFSEAVPLTIRAGQAAEGPRLSEGPQGQVALSWMERGETGGTLRYSQLLDNEWQEPANVVTDDNMFVNWADIPSVVPLGDGNWLAHWLTKSADSTYAYDVVISRSSDDGASWSEASAPHDDGTPTEHGFVSMSVERDATHMVWLDGRKTGNDRTEHSVDSSMTLRSADVDIHGTIFNEQQIDEFVCDCCRTDVAMTSQGRVAIYRNRTQEEIRDIYVTRHIDGEWQEGIALSNDNWKIAGCPVNGPAIAASDDLVAIAWFTAANNEPKVQLRISRDAGASFGDAILISQSNTIGQVDIAILDDTAVAVSWLEGRAGDSADQINIKLVSVTVHGTKGADHVVGRTAYRRAVPQMRLVDDGLVFAWVDVNGGPTRLASVRVPIKDDSEF